MVSTVFKKLNLKDQERVVVLNAPHSFEPELGKLDSAKVVRDPDSVKTVEFGLAFVTTQSELDRVSKLFVAKSSGDALVWVAYPKQTSKRYKCEFNRDSGWTVLRNAGFDTVRMVAIDEDWSALRFRRAEYIRSTTKNPAGAKPRN